MGLVGELLGKTDEAASGADDAAAKADDISGSAEDWFQASDDAGQNTKSVDVNADGSFYDNMGSNKRIVHDLSARAVEQPSRAVGGLTGNIASTAKVGILGAGGAYTAGKAMDYAAMDNKEKAYQTLQERLKEIENNDNLSPEQKEAAKERARQAYRESWGGNDGNGDGNSPSPFRGLLRMLGMADAAGKGSGPFGGVVGKLILGGAIIAGIFALPKVINAVKGGGR